MLVYCPTVEKGSKCEKMRYCDYDLVYSYISFLLGRRAQNRTIKVKEIYKLWIFWLLFLRTANAQNIEKQFLLYRQNFWNKKQLITPMYLYIFISNYYSINHQNIWDWGWQGFACSQKFGCWQILPFSIVGQYMKLPNCGERRCDYGHVFLINFYT